MRDRTFARSAETLTRSVGGEVLVTAPGRDQVDRLSPTAAAVWTLLEEPRTVSAVVGRLTEVFDAPAETIAGDVEALLADLVLRGWVLEVTHR